MGDGKTLPFYEASQCRGRSRTRTPVCCYALHPIRPGFHSGPRLTKPDTLLVPMSIQHSVTAQFLQPAETPLLPDLSPKEDP
jgi:hypothetical protein